MVLCLGPESSGKTSLLKRIVSQDKPFEDKTVPTVGVNLYKLSTDNEKVVISIRELGKN